VERRSIAHGTSSRSSKLIHGGLRYLETAQLGLVRESLHERTLMLRNAPELVELKPFHIPIFRTTRRRPWQIRTGLALYALLGGFGPGTAFGTVPRRQWDRLDGLTTAGLETVFRYHDGQTDDAALTRAIVRSAMDLGAELAMPVSFLRAELGASGVSVELGQENGSSRVAGPTREVEASVMVNAAGPWVNRVLERVTPEVHARRIELVQGAHIELPGRIEQGIYYVESPRDGRAVFVMPRDAHTLVGTTETRFRGDPDDVHALASEVSYLLGVVHHYFPDRPQTGARDVVCSFAGLRVLPAGEGHAFHRPRETLFDADRPGRPRLVSILGGKLTGWRATGEHLMRMLRPSLPARRRRADTRNLRLRAD